MEKSNAVTAVNISEQRIAAKISGSIVISGLAPMREITAGPSSLLGKPSTPKTSIQMNPREKRSLKSITKFTHFAVVLTASCERMRCSE
jgi:hypothetical protein